MPFFKYYGNHCAHCGILIENFDIFKDNDSPFYVSDVNTTKALTLFKIPMDEDIKAYCNIGYSSEDYLIKSM